MHIVWKSLKKVPFYNIVCYASCELHLFSKYILWILVSKICIKTCLFLAWKFKIRLFCVIFIHCVLCLSGYRHLSSNLRGFYIWHLLTFILHFPLSVRVQTTNETIFSYLLGHPSRALLRHEVIIRIITKAQAHLNQVEAMITTVTVIAIKGNAIIAALANTNLNPPKNPNVKKKIFHMYWQHCYLYFIL